MKIAVISEASTFEPIIKELREIAEVIVYDDTTTEQETVDRCKNIDIVLLNCWVAPLSNAVMDQLPSVRLIVTNTTGHDQIDTTYARSKNIAVANVPGFGTESVAEHALGLMLAVCRMIPAGDRLMKQQPVWVDPKDEQMQTFQGFTLQGKVLGILGLGAIGTRLSELAQALGIQVIAYNRTAKTVDGVRLVSMEEVLKASDIVSVNLALNDDTRHIINAERLALMKPQAILINTARDGHIDVDALYAALRDKKIRGAGLDGIAASSEHPILNLDNIVLTPHSGWYTIEAEQAIADTVLENVQRFMSGRPINIVN